MKHSQLYPTIFLFNIIICTTSKACELPKIAPSRASFTTLKSQKKASPPIESHQTISRLRAKQKMALSWKIWQIAHNSNTMASKQPVVKDSNLKKQILAYKPRSIAITKPSIGDTIEDTSLHEASKQGDSEMVHILLAIGANVHHTTSDGQTPLHMAASAGHTKIGKLLITAGADVNIKNENGQIPLHFAAMHGNSGMMKLLLNAGADLHAKDTLGCTALHLAAKGGNNEIIKILLAREADMNAKTNKGDTALDLALANHFNETALMLSAAKAVANKIPISLKT